VPILRVETSVVDEVDTTTDDIIGGEGGPVGLPRARGAERVAIISVVTVRVLIPAGQAVHVDTLGGEANAHVPVPTLADNLDFKVVEAAGRRDRVGGPDTGGILVSLPVT